MISGRYVWNELRRRWSRTLLTALGLAAGVGLTMGIVGVSNGLTKAQNSVLSPLSSVGTDIIVERTVGVAQTASSTGSSGSSTSSTTTTTTATSSAFGSGDDSGEAGTTTTTASSGAGALAPSPKQQGVGFYGGGSGSSQNQQDASALQANNSAVITDLSKLGPPGTQFTHDFFVPGTLITFDQSTVADLSALHGVKSAVPGLSLDALHESGTVPKITDSVTTGGQTITQTQSPAPLTADEEKAVITCLENSNALPSSPPTNLDFTSSSGQAITNCLPERMRTFITQYVVPKQTISHILSPPATDTASRTYTVAGIDPANQISGLITKSQLVTGTWFTSDPADEVLVNTAYASTNRIAAGQTLSIDNLTYQVVGLVNPTLAGDASDIYFDLSTLQSQSSQSSRINEVLIQVDKASDVGTVASAIKRDLPGATVLTSKDLDATVSGSLTNAKKLASNLGVALGIIILVATLLIAALLTLSSIAKRVREIGTLRAVGWSRSKVMMQILGEMLGIGVVGAVLGVAVGLVVCLAVNAFGPTLAYSTSGVAVGASSASSLIHGVATTVGSTGRAIKLHTSISAMTVLGAVASAVLGGLTAGLLGAWRAARLSPTTALRDIG